jgi:aminopeptidase
MNDQENRGQRNAGAERSQPAAALARRLEPMPDPRWETLAEILLGHSTRLEAGETLLVECFDLEDDTLPRLLVQKAARKGAYAIVDAKSTRIIRELARSGSESSMKILGDVELYRMKQVQAYIALRGSRNISEMADVSPEKLALYNTHYMKPVHFEQRIRGTKWCVLRMPGPSMAQQAGMSTEAFEDFYFDVCNIDYPRLSKALAPLVERMTAAREVRITAPGTDLSFSIEGIPVVPCSGEMNIPDGEVFTAPVRDSIEGCVRFNAPTIYQGASFDGIELEFHRGKITRSACSAGDAERLRRILDADEGAAYVGEWSIGCNPRILRPMRDILFDEKIAGSFHLTPGNAYDEADNGNRSKIHWDLVQIQRPEWGGGSIFFDGKPIRIDGLFVPEELKALDPE